MSGAREIILRDEKNIPHSVTVPRIGLRIERGRPVVTDDEFAIEYAANRQHLFTLRDPAQSGIDPTLPRAVAVAPVAEPAPQNKASVDDADVDTPAAEKTPAEAWFDLFSGAEDKRGPRNDDIMAFADANGIDLDGATKKSDMIEIIEAAIGVSDQ